MFRVQVNRFTIQKYIRTYRNMEGGNVIKRGVKYDFLKIWVEKTIQIKKYFTVRNKKLDFFILQII